MTNANKTFVKFTVYGKPLGKGRPRFRNAGKYIQSYSPKETVNYEVLVRTEYTAQCGAHRFPDNMTLGMLVTAVIPIPKSASKRNKERMLEGTIRPGKKPDWDNVGKVICDALNGIAFRDDALIVDGRTIKRYGERPLVTVEIWEEAEHA